MHRLALPAGTRVLSADSWGNSSWNITARIDALEPNGAEKRYFLKVSMKLNSTPVICLLEPFESHVSLSSVQPPEMVVRQ